MDKRLLELLCCPVARTAVRVAERAELDALNRAIGAGGVRNAGGTIIDRPLPAALVTVDRARAYPVVDDIPVILADEAIIAAEVEGFAER